jgi:hypothetical protein
MAKMASRYKLKAEDAEAVHRRPRHPRKLRGGDGVHGSAQPPRAAAAPTPSRATATVSFHFSTSPLFFLLRLRWQRVELGKIPPRRPDGGTPLRPGLQWLRLLAVLPSSYSFSSLLPVFLWCQRMEIWKIPLVVARCRGEAAATGVL